MTDFFKSRHQYNCKTKQILLVNFFSEVTHKKHCKEILLEINVHFTLQINETVKLKVPFTNTLMNFLLEVTPEVNTVNKF